MFALLLVYGAAVEAILPVVMPISYRFLKGETYCLVNDPRQPNQKCPTGSEVMSLKSERLDNPYMYFKENIVNFVIVQNEEDEEREFDLSKWTNYSVFIGSPLLGAKARVYLRPGHAATNTTWKFDRVDVNMRAGDFYFDELRVRETRFVKRQGIKQSVIHQERLETDFESFANLDDMVAHDPPTHGIVIHLSKKVRDVAILEEHVLTATCENMKATFDLVGVDEDFPPPVVHVGARVLNLEVLIPEPSFEREFPRVHFMMDRATGVVLNGPELPHELHDLSDRITFVHGARTLHMESKNGYDIPTFEYIGSGAVYYNNVLRMFYNDYCLCGGTEEECQSLCNAKPVTSYADINKTILGNPNDKIDYIVAGSKPDVYPMFHVEYFGDHNISIRGATETEHIGVFGEVDLDDEGDHVFFGVEVHLCGEEVRFPDVEFSEVTFACSGDKCNVYSNELKIDYRSYSSIKGDVIVVNPAPMGTEIHATGIVEAMNIEFVSKFVVKVNDVSVSANQDTHSLITVRTGGSVTMILGDKIRTEGTLDDVARLRIVMEGDSNHVVVTGDQWPDGLMDVTAKVVLCHNDNPVHITGEILDKGKYRSSPTIFAHEGNGAIYFNGILSNYNDQYCVCEGAQCEQYCEEHGSIIGYSAKAIAQTVAANPSRSIAYLVHGTKKTQRAVFKLSDFRVHSFSIFGHNREYITLQGADDSGATPPSSVSHTFEHVDIEFQPEQWFCFNNLVLTEVRISHDEADANREYNTIIRGMTADFGSLVSFEEHGMVAPCSLYMTIVGGTSLARVVIKDETTIAVENQFGGRSVDIDVSQLEHPVTITSSGASMEVPFVVHWGMQSRRADSIPNIPSMNIDVSDIEHDAYIMFTGRQWTGFFHNISEHISVLYGETDIYIEAERNGNDYVGQPPHVHLDGEGDYYINGKRQATFKSEGDHDDDDDSDPDSGVFRGFFYLILVALIVYAVFFLYDPNCHSRKYGSIVNERMSRSVEDDTLLNQRGMSSSSSSGEPAPDLW